MTAPVLDQLSDMGATGHSVRLELPADSRFLRVARLAAAGLADEAGFDLDDVENLRIAVDEAGGALMEVADAGAGVQLEFHLGAGIVRFVGSVDARTAPSLHPLAQSVLEVLTLDLELARHDGRATISFHLGADDSGRPGDGT